MKSTEVQNPWRNKYSVVYSREELPSGKVPYPVWAGPRIIIILGHGCFKFGNVIGQNEGDYFQ